MSEARAEVPFEPGHPANWPPHPAKKMLMTPMVATVGSLMAFFTVVFVVVVLPTTTFEPPPSENWRPFNAEEAAGRQIFLANGCVYCHSGFVRPQDVFSAQYYLYPRISEPGDYVGTGESPNLFGTVRTGPDLTQDGGFHPDDWHYAHFANPRFVDPLSIMPSFSFLSQQEVRDLVAFTQARGGKVADIRAQHQQTVKALELASSKVAAAGEKGDRSDGYPAAIAIKNLMLVERGYWFTDNPLPVTRENLMRGRQVFQERCIGCHGSLGDGKGPAATLLNPQPAAFNVADDQQHGSDTSPGAYYWRILRGLPGSAMENFGTRLSVDDIWKVVLFIKTIPNGGLTADLPTPAMYVRWQGYPGLYTWADCFDPVTGGAATAATPPSAPIPGVGDVPGIVALGELNPLYAVVLWELQNNARPCASKGFERVTRQEIAATSARRTDGYARQGEDQIPFIPASLLDQSQMPPRWLDQVWGKPNPLANPAGTNR